MSVFPSVPISISNRFMDDAQSKHARGSLPVVSCYYLSMQSGPRQVRFALIWTICISLVSTTAAQVPSGRYARQLAQECDQLIQSAVRRPYGWGWDIVALTATRGSAATPRHVTLEPLGTPAAGLLLLWSGQLLEEPRYRQA